MNIAMIAPATAASTTSRAGSPPTGAPADGFGALLGIGAVAPAAGSKAGAGGMPMPAQIADGAELTTDPALAMAVADPVAVDNGEVVPDVATALAGTEPIVADTVEAVVPETHPPREGKTPQDMADALAPATPEPQPATAQAVVPASVADDAVAQLALAATQAEPEADAPAETADGGEATGQPVDAPRLQVAPPMAPVQTQAQAATTTADTADAPTPNLLNQAVSARAAKADTASATAPASAEAGTPSFDVAGAAPLADSPDGLPTSLLSQALPNAAPRPAGQPYPAAHAAAPQPVVTAQPGQIGREMGVEIARSVAAGKDEVLIRLDPAEMGRIDVRLSFDREGSLRAVVAADSPAALDMLRRDAGDLTRALADAGVRADTQSFRFDSRGGDAGSGWQRGQQGEQGRGGSGGMAQGSAGTGDEPIHYRPLRASGRVDLMA